VSFIAFVTQYYAERLHAYEQLDLTRCADVALLDAAGEATALHKFLTDIVEEGYTTLDVCFVHTPPVIRGFPWERRRLACFRSGLEARAPRQASTGEGLVPWTSSQPAR